MAENFNTDSANDVETLIKLVIEQASKLKSGYSAFILQTRVASLVRILEIAQTALSDKRNKKKWQNNDLKTIHKLNGALVEVLRILRLLEPPILVSKQVPDILAKLCILGQLFESKGHYDKATIRLCKSLNKVAGMNIRSDPLQQKMLEDDKKDCILIFDVLDEFCGIDPNILGGDVAKYIEKLQTKLKLVKADASGKEERSLETLGGLAVSVRQVAQHISFNLGIGSTRVKRKRLTVSTEKNGTLYNGTYGKTNVLVHTVTWNRKYSVTKRSHIRNELRNWYEKLSNGKHIMKLHGYCHDGTIINVVLERCQGSLSEFIENRTYNPNLVNTTAVCAIADGILRGLLFLHKLGIVHQHLCPENIFLGGESRSMVKIGGFGALVENPAISVYDAPEILQAKVNQKQNCSSYFSADVYSFALVLWRILHDYAPYGNISPDSLVTKICKEGDRPEFSGDVHVETWLKNIVTSSWKESPWNRPSVIEILTKFDIHKPNSSPRPEHTIRSLLQGSSTCKKEIPDQNEASLGTFLELLRDHLEDFEFSTKIMKAIKMKFDKSNAVEAYGILVEHNSLPLFVDLFRLYPESVVVQNLSFIMIRLCINAHSRMLLPLESQQKINIIDMITSCLQDYNDNEEIFVCALSTLDTLAQTIDAESCSLIDEKLWEALLNGLRQHVSSIRVRKLGLGLVALLMLRSEEREDKNFSVRLLKDTFKLMKENKRDSDVQLSALESICDLASMSKSFRQTCLESDDAVKTLFGIMNRYSNTPGIQERGMNLIALLSSTQGDHIRSDSFNMLNVIINTMKGYASNQSIQTSGCDALSNFATCADSEYDQNLIESGTLDLIFEAFSKHNSSKEVSQAAITAFGSFARGGNEARSVLLEKDVISLIIARYYLFRQDATLTASALNTFSYSWTDSDHTKSQAIKQNIIAIIASAMREHEDDSAVQRSGCSCVASLALLEKDIVYKKVVSEDLLNLLSETIKCHSDEADVVLEACRCVANLSLSSRLNKKVKESFAQSGLLRNILRTMKQNKNSFKLQETGAWALWGLFTNCKTTCTAEELAAVTQVLSKTCKAYPNRAKVNQPVFWVLACICMNFPKTCEYIISSELPMLAIQALNYFATKEHVAAPILWFLRHLMAEDDMQLVSQLVEAGAPKAVLTTMRKNRKSEQIQEPALYLLGSLSPLFSEESMNPSLCARTVEKVMSVHLTNTNVCMAGAYFLSKVTAGTRDELLRTQLLSLMKDAVQIHNADHGFCLRAFEAVTNMSTPDTCLEMIELVVSLMFHLQQDAVIQEHGIMTLVYLIRSNVEETDLDEAGTFIAESVIETMQKHDRNLKVQENSAELLWLLSSLFGSATSQYLIITDILSSITKAMKRFPKANKLQYNLSRVLGALCESDPSFGHAIIDGDALGCIVNTIGSKEQNRLCQETACSALCKITKTVDAPDRDMLAKKNVKDVLKRTKETPMLNHDVEAEINDSIRLLSSWTDYIWG